MPTNYLAGITPVFNQIPVRSRVRKDDETKLRDRARIRESILAKILANKIARIYLIFYYLIKFIVHVVQSYTTRIHGFLQNYTGRIQMDSKSI